MPLRSLRGIHSVSQRECSWVVEYTFDGALVVVRECTRILMPLQRACVRLACRQDVQSVPSATLCRISRFWRVIPSSFVGFVVFKRQCFVGQHTGNHEMYAHCARVFSRISRSSAAKALIFSLKGVLWCALLQPLLFVSRDVS